MWRGPVGSQNSAAIRITSSGHAAPRSMGGDATWCDALLHALLPLHAPSFTCCHAPQAARVLTAAVWRRRLDEEEEAREGGGAGQGAGDDDGDESADDDDDDGGDGDGAGERGERRVGGERVV